MNIPYILELDSVQADLNLVGGKGASLSRIINAGLPVPGGFHITTRAYNYFIKMNNLQNQINKALTGVDTNNLSALEVVSRNIIDLFLNAQIPDEITNAVVNAYLSLIGENVPVAVRSSATAEDLPEASFAGQQDTMLNVVGSDAVLEAVRNCWASLWTARAIGYRVRQNISSAEISQAVIVQILVPAEVAGIMFTANPLNGNRDQLVINASWGLGEAIVGGMVDPDILVVDKESCKLLDQEIARKLVQTVATKTGTEEQPVPIEIQNIPALKVDFVAELAGFGKKIENLYRVPMDVEWVLLDGTFSIVQARQITVLHEVPIDWSPPDPKGVYMRGSVVDLMPDPISPLFASLGIPTLMKQMSPLGKRMTRFTPVLADDYFTSINGYAYMDAYIPPKAWGWILIGLLPSYPKFLTKLVPMWRKELLPEYRAYVDKVNKKTSLDMSIGELWRESQGILDAAMYYICSLMFATMGASAGSEMLVTKVYDKFYKQDGDPPASVLLMGWDNIPIRSEKSLFDLANWISQNSSLADWFSSTSTSEIIRQIQEDSHPPDLDVEIWAEFERRFQAHLDNFGYVIYQLDFAQELPLDHPEPMLETMKMYLRGEGINPHERQQRSEEIRIQTVAKVENQLKGIKLWLFRKVLGWGQPLAEVREDALAEIGLGYPKLREMLVLLGQYFSENDVIKSAGDIFWLEKTEIDLVINQLEDNDEIGSLSGKVEERKTFWKRVKAVTPPPMIPMKERVMGVKADLFISHTQDSDSGDILKGVAASGGVVTAPACVLHGPRDFELMHPGNVLVAGTTTPAWTPLFAMASAVVTDIGGPLSHGSIVAREYGIPAVMGTSEATRRIQTGQIITVDGGKGTVTILK